MINAGKEFKKCLDEIEDPRKKLLFGQGFIKGFNLANKIAREDLAKAFELLTQGKLSEEIEKLKKEAR